MIAFFDLDRTLIDTNSANGWIRREIRLGHLGMSQALRGAAWIALYQMGFGQMEPVLRDAVKLLEGQVEDELRKRTLDFWNEDIAGRIRPGARPVIEQHRAAGDTLALLTTSSNYLGDAAAEALNLDVVLCNRFEVHAGLFTGKTVEPLCYATGKLHYATKLANQHGVDLKDCAFYTDSYSDLSVMEVVGQPVAVHPDPRLSRHARKQGWTIAYW